MSEEWRNREVGSGILMVLGLALLPAFGNFGGGEGSGKGKEYDEEPGPLNARHQPV